jgi:signal transduction histidine kinase
MFASSKKRGMNPSTIIKGTLLGTLVGLFVLSPASMVFSDYVHSKFPPEHVLNMLSSRWVGITELFKIEALPWNVYFALVGCGIGFFVAYYYEKLLTGKNEAEDIKNELNAILFHIAEGVLVEDRNHNVRFMNDALKKIYGDKVKRKCYEVFYTNPYPENTCAVESVVNKGKGCVFYEIVDRDGRELWITAAPLHYKDDTFVVEIYRDVTEINRMKRTLTRSDKMITIGQLSAGIAHELRNPLSAIDSARFYLAEVIKDRDSSITEELERIERCVQRSQEIINDLLNFSRDSTEERERVNINDVLESALALVEDELLTRDIEIIKGFGELPHTYLNVGAMKQAFINVIVNAIQAIDSVGRLEVATKTEKGNRSIRIIIKDSGPGIEENDLQKIFDPFFTKKKDKKGTGLGLAITRSIIERDGGYVSVKSTIGKGTTFSLELPICDSPQCPCYPDQQINRENSSYEVF